MLERVDITNSIKQEMHNYCQRQIAVAQSIGAGYEKLWTEIDAYLAGGGKRIRPYLMLLAYEAYGGTNITASLPVAASWELLHSGLLVHDDIIDRDMTRHGSLNIAGKYRDTYGTLSEHDADHYALSSALLAGDLLLFAANDIIATADELTPEQKLRAMSYIQSGVFSVGGGELLDLESVLYPIKTSQPIAIAEYKTASYSFQLPLECGAALANAPDTELSILHEIGTNIGVAFQLRDDILGVYGSEAETGKSNRSDIYEKKRTLLVQYAHEHLEDTEKQKLDILYSVDTDIGETEVVEVLQLLDKSSAKQTLESVIANYSEQANQQISTLSIGEAYKAELRNLVAKASGRSS